MQKLGDLSKRFTMSLIAVAFLLAVWLCSSFVIGYFFLAILGIFLAYVAASEWIHLVEAKKIVLSKYLVISAVGVQVVTFFLSALFFELKMLPWITFFCLMVTIFIYNLHKIKDAIFTITTSFFPVIYVGFPIGMALCVLLDSFHDGKAWFVFLILVTKLNDIFAYFFGKLFGKTKIVPKVSPKKTVLGTLVGVFTSITVCLAFYLFRDFFLFFNLNLWQTLLFGIIFGCSSFFGDISESLLKRDASVKDSNVLPGLGGVLDLLDSLAWNIPFLYFYLNWM